MRISIKILTLTFLLTLVSVHLLSQNKNVYNEMSLDEILNVDVVVTASKQPEDLFETPLSVTIITKEEISQAGATSIMEALRLSQGLIVREVTPGNFDVQIRGFDDMTKNAFLFLPYNTTILVMIDNRIAYNYYSGGTFWETLSIDVNDIERIEIVRGPASALYGPNAATGVINIITTQSHEKGLSAFASAKIGNQNTKIANANIAYNWKDKTNLSFTTNFTERNRFDNLYYDWWVSEYSSLDDLNMMMEIEKDPITHEAWTFKDFSNALNNKYNVNQSLEKLGVNLFFAHQFDEKSNFNLSLGFHDSESQKVGFLNFATPLSQYNSRGFHIDNKFTIHNFHGQWNISKGEVLGNSANSFKYRNFDINLEYLYQYKSLSLRPGISYKNSNYNSPITYDEPFSLAKLNYQFKDEPRMFNSVAASLLIDWNPISKLRVIGGLRIDKFNVNKNYFANYELAATYRLNKSNLVRFVLSRANRSPSFFDTFVNTEMSFYYGFKHENNVNPIYVPIIQQINARKDQKYPTNNSIEVSWRSKLSQEFDIDFELFYQKMNNFLVSNEFREIQTTIQLNDLYELDSVFSGSGIAHMYFENYDLGASQIGLSFMLNYKPGSKLDLKLFGTIQKTFLSGDYAFEFNKTEPTTSYDPVTNTAQIIEHSSVNMTILNEKVTPTIYGGFMMNYKPNKKLNVNVSGYLYSKQVFAGNPFSNIIADYTEVYYNEDMTINPYAIINGKLSYTVFEKSKIFISFKNLFGEHREFGFSDNIGTTFLIGFNWNY